MHKEHTWSSICSRVMVAGCCVCVCSKRGQLGTSPDSEVKNFTIICRRDAKFRDQHALEIEAVCCTTTEHCTIGQLFRVDFEIPNEMG